VTKAVGRRAAPTSLLARLIEAPDLVRRVQVLPPPSFAALVRRVGVADAGELVALATVEQLVAAFDEDLFVNPRPGEREAFDRDRFAVWLEVLLEAGEEAAATRILQLSEDFVVRALSSLVLVLEQNALDDRLNLGGEDAVAADRAIESSLSEEIEGYLLISLQADGWDAALALILALDRDHRDALVRLLDRCAATASGYLDDLGELATVLSACDSLAEDVEAEREERRTRSGYVEPRAARSFLLLAREPLGEGEQRAERDPITRAHFRDLDRERASLERLQAPAAPLPELLEASEELAAAEAVEEAAGAEGGAAFRAALRLLGESDPRLLGERLEELGYLANVLAAAGESETGRLRPAQAAEAALATAALGAALAALARRGRSSRAARRARASELADVLRDTSCDLLFRRASSALVAREPALPVATAFLRTAAEIDPAVAALTRSPRRRRSRVATRR